MEGNHYFHVLNLEPGAGKDEIRKAYRFLAKKYHPDLNKAKGAQQKFIEITEAYEILIKSLDGKAYPQHGKTSSGSVVYTEEERREYEYFREMAREKARKMAEMRYEKFKMQHEVYEKSGLNDISRLIRLAWKTFLLCFPFILVLLALKMFRANEEELYMPLVVIGAVFSLVIIWYAWKHRRDYFRSETLYYNFKRISEIYRSIETTSEDCSYCHGKKGGAPAYTVSLLKNRDILLSTDGPRQHNINYKNDYKVIRLPRSARAFYVHSSATVIKVLSIILCLCFFSPSSMLWRFIIGLFAGGLISTVLHLLTRTRTKAAFLFSPKILTKAILWFLLILFTSDIQFSPFQIRSSEYIQFILGLILLFDCFLDQGLNRLGGLNLNIPIPRQSAELRNAFKDGYRLYNDIPVWTVLYPLIKWVFR